MADFMRSSVHCHSTLCDGKNTLQEMASAACAQGLVTLGFTGHSHTPCDREYCMSPRRTALYKATIAKLKAEYKGKVDILCGIEWDQFSDDKRVGYDYWIGSVHYLHGANTGKYYEIDFRKQDLAACIADDFGGDAKTLIIHNDDTHGCIAEVALALARRQINVASMQVFRSAPGGEAVMVLGCARHLPAPPEVQLTAVPGLPQGPPLEVDAEA